jgi:hypothetical protein
MTAETACSNTVWTAQRATISNQQRLLGNEFNEFNEKKDENRKMQTKTYMSDLVFLEQSGQVMTLPYSTERYLEGMTLEGSEIQG